MGHIADLATFGDPQLLAVGWLSREHEYARGPVSDAFVKSLLSALKNPWQPAYSAGRHRCEFCRITGGPSELRHDSLTISMGASNLYVPGRGVVFVAPSLIAHYVDAHEYAPPTAFQEAVKECPPMRSVAYLRALLGNSPPSLLESIRTRRLEG